MTEDRPGLDAGAELYRRFLAGDEAGFEELVALYRKGLVRYLNGFVNDWREAEDLALDAFAELAIGANYKGGSSLKTYLFAIGRHLALRHVKRYGHTDNILMDEILEEIGGGENAVEADYLREEQKERLHAAIRTLKPEYREVLYLVSFEDMSYAEAGKTMHKTEKQIANLVHRAKASLKKILDSEKEKASLKKISDAEGVKVSFRKIPDGEGTSL